MITYTNWTPLSPITITYYNCEIILATGNKNPLGPAFNCYEAQNSYRNEYSWYVINDCLSFCNYHVGLEVLGPDRPLRESIDSKSVVYLNFSRVLELQLIPDR